MAALAELSEEECYLWAIIQDESGIDLGEFTWTDPENDDNIWRAWPFQWSWYRCDDPKQIDQCARAVGKTGGIELRMFSHVLRNPGQEAAILAPELIHLEQVTQKIEMRIDAVRLTREMKRKDPTHRPFSALFLNSARLVGRIPGPRAAGCKGLHPLILELDEGQDFIEAGWKELVETVKRGSEGAVWRAHGVTKGMGRDSFYRNSHHGEDDPPLRYISHKDENKWTVHRIPAMAKPNWSDAERQEKIHEYGSKDDPDYRRNVLGSHGDAQSPIFNLIRLMRCVDDDPGSEFNVDDYWHREIKDTELERLGGEIITLVDPPSTHFKYKSRPLWVGMDVGLVIDPSEILIFAEVPITAADRAEAKARSKKVPENGNRLKLIGRVTLKRIANPDQVELILHLIDFYKPKAFAMDATGIGLPMFQDIQKIASKELAASEVSVEAAQRFLRVLKPYGFSQKIVVEFDESIELPENITMEERIKESGIRQNVLEVSTDILRTYVDEGRLWLPMDIELVDEMRGQTYSNNKIGMDQYGRRRVFSNGHFHALDAMRMAALGHRQFAIEELMRTKPAETGPVLDSFMSAW
jgi:hypothetical protein